MSCPSQQVINAVLFFEASLVLRVSGHLTIIVAMLMHFSKVNTAREARVMFHNREGAAGNHVCKVYHSHLHKNSKVGKTY